MKTNRPVPRSKKEVTHEGGLAKRITPEQELRRTVASCLLWEDQFYEDGRSIADRIAAGVKTCKQEFVEKLAVQARTEFKLRHAPLLICRELARQKKLKAETLTAVIQRADELAEFLAIYWKDKKQPLSGQVKKGLAAAFTKFSAYNLAKYNRDGAVKLRDVLFLSHAKPMDEAQAAIWKQLVDGTLPVPDTWEVALSGGADKKETWERLIAEKKLGALALLRNLRNMEQAKVPFKVMQRAVAEMDPSRVLPFRFIAAARYAPRLEEELEDALFKSVENLPKIGGETTLLIDVSGSMDGQLSDKSDMTRMDAACGVAMVARELCPKGVRVFTFSEKLVEVPGSRQGFAMRDAIVKSQAHNGTYLGNALNGLPDTHRLIVISDEQAHDDVMTVKADRAYMINVASYRNGVGYGGKWTHIDGFSESVIRYIQELEGLEGPDEAA